MHGNAQSVALDGKFACRYNIKRESNKTKMIADCKECGGRATLKNSKCMIGILNAMSKEYNVDSIILSHYIETRYSDAAMDLLRKKVELLREFDQLSIREPYNEYFLNDDELTSAQKSKQKTVCEKCGLKPSLIFTTLKNSFIKDIDHFYNDFSSLSGNIAKHKEPQCSSCIKTSKSDFIYIFNRLEELRAFVVYEGFQIVI